jgi:hypothetical protein
MRATAVNGQAKSEVHSTQSRRTQTTGEQKGSQQGVRFTVPEHRTHLLASVNTFVVLHACTSALHLHNQHYTTGPGVHMPIETRLSVRADGIRLTSVCQEQKEVSIVQVLCSHLHSRRLLVPRHSLSAHQHGARLLYVLAGHVRHEHGLHC